MAAAVFGLAGWTMALSLLPRHFWWQFPSLRTDLPDWLVYAALGLAVAALIARGILTRRWLIQLRGHGYEWILDWGRGKPYFARLLATRVLVGLGYRD